MEIVVVLLIIAGLIYLKVYTSGEKERTRNSLRKENENNLNVKGTIKCPKCYSTQISANKRGVTVTTGLIGTQQVYITCLQCGHRWKAGS